MIFVLIVENLKRNKMERREIKFRGFSLDSNKWIYGYLNRPFEDITQIIENIPSNASQMSLIANGSEGQFTGLFDKNRKEIYEGDIFSYIDNESDWKCSFIGDVVWIKSESSFGMRTDNDCNTFTSDYDIKENLLNHLEVIGNIYENSNLLNKRRIFKI